MSATHTAVLKCHQCGVDSRHELWYAGRLLIGTRCTACGHEIDMADFGRYLADLKHRAATKPRRMLRRLWRDPAQFIRTLPAAAATKPMTVVHELANVAGRAAVRPRRGGPVGGGPDGVAPDPGTGDQADALTSVRDSAGPASP